MDDNKDRTLYCGNLSEKVTEDLLYELFLQAGPLESVSIPKEKDGRQKNFGFVTFKHAVSVPYSVALMDGIALFGKTLRLDVRSGAKNAPNPYLEQLRQYRNARAQLSRQNDQRMPGSSRSRQQDARRYDARTENSILGEFDPRSLLPRGGYAGYNQSYVFPQNVPAQQNVPQGYPMNYGMYPNQWSQFR